MNLDELQSVRDRERQTDKLQQLRESFYADAGSFIQQLRDERDRAAERADNPYDAPEVQQLTDEINTAEQTVENIYEKRVGKLVKAASFAAADLPAEVDGMTAEEQDLFDTLVENIKGNREHVLDVLAGEAVPTDTPATQSTAHEQSAEQQAPEEPSAGTPSPDQSPADPTEVSAADVMGAGEQDHPPAPGLGGEEEDPYDQSPPEQASEESPPIRNDGGTPAQAAETSTGGRHDGPASTDDSVTEADSSDQAGSSAETAGVERETVRITDDVGTFVGFDDREYDLSTNDVVQLPATNVGPLLEQGAAEQF